MTNYQAVNNNGQVWAEWRNVADFVLGAKCSIMTNGDEAGFMEMDTNK